MLNKPVVRQWVDALRSGKYAQTKGRLTKIDEHGNKAHCCLGVLCELAVQNGLDIDSVAVKDPVYGNMVEYSGSVSVPPLEVEDWAGIYHWDVISGIDQPYLPALNDTYDWTFEQIADAIERTHLKENTNA